MKKPLSIGALLGTSSSDIYTVPASFNSDIETITISNNNGSGVAVTLTWYDATTATTYTLVDAHQMGANDLFQLTNPLYLKAGDKISGLASSASHIRISIRAQEEYTQVKLT